MRFINPARAAQLVLDWPEIALIQAKASSMRFLARWLAHNREARDPAADR
jgi:hypothetical protein